MVGVFRRIKHPALAFAGLGVFLFPAPLRAADPPLPPISNIKSTTGGSAGSTTGQPPANQQPPQQGNQQQSQAAQQPPATQETITADPAASKSLGRFRTKDGTVKVAEMYLDRYKESMVIVTVRDGGGNVLGSGMGVALAAAGTRSSRYIAAPLSVVLGNNVQWADEIVITQHDGEEYNADIALVNEQLDLVLLDPEIRPAAIPFTRPLDERPQISLFLITHEKTSGTPKSKIMVGKLAGLNQERGTLSVTKDNNSLRTFPWDLLPQHAGTGLINAQGELVGILLPKQKGVLASTLQQLVAQALKMKPMPPPMLGVVMGRGVLVAADVDGAYKSVNAALAAVESGAAPKMDPKRFTPARDRELSPAESDKVVIKIMPGKYTEEKPIRLRSHLSLVGSGPDLTVVTAQASPLILGDGLENVVISGLRLQPAASQTAADSTVHVRRSGKLQVTGSILESRGGTALRLEKVADATVAGNVFPGGRAGSRGLLCERSDLAFEANGIFGAWGQGLVAGESCSVRARRNLVMQAEAGLVSEAKASSFDVAFNTFIDTKIGVQLLGSPSRF
ncbi:MAG: hypothetical protein HUU37_06725, partial [Bdellovibrionales bacterium]|nr:hypothetical protein [Bdellovibrionales bacterium]